ncbi:MAG: hypothetical protein Q8R55_01220 [Candidatus Taylorbacteria bacterium]|nr:hypothetical protein [Candidatus Taylorbacteria bacterium]
MINLVIKIKTSDTLTLQLKKGYFVIDDESLTISQNLDNMLITAIDRLLAKNRIDRLSLETLEIQGEMSPEAVSSMIIKTIRSGLKN